MVGFKDKDQEMYAKAVQALERGDVSAKTYIAFCKLTGRGGAEKDVDGAVAFLKERAEAFDEEAMWMLGLCYEFGIGVEKDVKEAERLYRDAHYSPVAMFFLANKKHEIGSTIMEIEGLLH